MMTPQTQTQGPPISDRVRAMVRWLVEHAAEVGDAADPGVRVEFNAGRGSISVSITRFDQAWIDGSR